MNKLKISAMVLSLCMGLSTVANAASFTDMPSEPEVAAAIENAVKNGLISGYEDNTVRPDAPIRRSEMAVIITQACKVTKEGNISRFEDVAKTDWFYSAMAKSYEMGAFSGDGNRMNPNNNISVQECFTVLSQVFDLLPPYERPYPIPEKDEPGKYVMGNRVYDITMLDGYADSADVAYWAKPYVAGVVANGGWNGVDGKLIPKEYITRAQFASVMDKLIQNYIDEPGTYTELPEGNTMVRCDDAVFENAIVKGDLYIGDSVSADGITINNITIDGRFVIRGCATPTVGEDGETSYGSTPGITASGIVGDVRIIRPYILADILKAKYESIYAPEKSTALFSLSM